MRSIAPGGGMMTLAGSKPLLTMPSEVFIRPPSTITSVYAESKPRMEICVLPILVSEMSTPGTSPTA